MQAIADLQKQWRERERFRARHAHLALESDGVVLGANTLVAKRNDGGALEADEARALTLLAVAYGQPADRSILGRINLASKHACAGNEAMAAMHIALAGLPVLRDPEDAAKRLFIADGLIEKGVAPRDIWTALEFDPAPLDALTKFNPDEARVPAGSGRPSGRWTRDGSDALVSPAPELAPQPPGAAPSAAARALEAASAAARAAARLIPKIAPKLLDIAADAAPPIAFASALLDSTPAGGPHFEGEIPGRPDLRYSWNQDETQLKIIRSSDGRVVFTATASDHGTFRDADGRIIARVVGDKITVDPSLFFPKKEAKLADPDEDRGFCPEPDKDKAGRPGEKGDPDRDYEDYVKSYVNPQPYTTERGEGYRLPNPENFGIPVFYDDCQRQTGVLVEAKGRTYARLLSLKGNPSEGTIKKMLRQATIQVQASQGRPIVWFFAERSAADKARELFNEDPRLERIQIFYLPMPGWQQ